MWPLAPSHRPFPTIASIVFGIVVGPADEGARTFSKAVWLIE